MSVKAGQSGHNIAEKSRKGPGARYYRFAAAEAEHVGGFVYAPGRNNFEATRQIDDIGRSAGRNRLRKNHLARWTAVATFQRHFPPYAWHYPVLSLVGTHMRTELGFNKTMH